MRAMIPDQCLIGGDFGVISCRNRRFTPAQELWCEHQHFANSLAQYLSFSVAQVEQIGFCLRRRRETEHDRRRYPSIRPELCAH